MFAPLFWNVGLAEDIPGDVLDSLVRLRDTGRHLHWSASFKKFPNMPATVADAPGDGNRTGPDGMRPMTPKAGFCLTVMEDPSHAVA